MNDKNNSLCGEDKKDIERFSDDEPRSDDITAPSPEPDNIGNGHRLRFIPDRKAAAIIAEFTGQIASNHGISPKISGRIKIVTCEITSNIIDYSGASLAEMSYSIYSDRLEILFADNGMPFDPLKVEAPDITLPAEERSIGGLGIFLVREMAESVEYKYENNKNILKVTMALN